jgi:hypothetical protein
MQVGHYVNSSGEAEFKLKQKEMGKDRPRDIHLGASKDFNLYGNQTLRAKLMI